MNWLQPTKLNVSFEAFIYYTRIIIINLYIYYINEFPFPLVHA